MMMSSTRVIMIRGLFLIIFAQMNNAGIPKSLNGFHCERGHGIPPQYCHTAMPASISISEPNEKRIYFDRYKFSQGNNNQITEELLARWNITIFNDEIINRNQLNSINSSAFFFEVSYSKDIGGSINYYQFHVDVLLPLYAAFEQQGILTRENSIKNPAYKFESNVILFPKAISPINDEDLTSIAFQEINSFWYQSLQIMINGRPSFDSNIEVDGQKNKTFNEKNLLVGTSEQWHQLFNNQRYQFNNNHEKQQKNIIATQFSGEVLIEKGEFRLEKTIEPIEEELSKKSDSLQFLQGLSFGLPSLEMPPRGLVSRFVQFMRSQLRLSDEPIPCDEADIIGFVRRTNRRILTNEKELLEALRVRTGAEIRFIEFGQPSDYPLNYEDNDDDQYDKLNVLKNSTYLNDVLKVQNLRILLGGQGSGLINGIYLRPLSSTMVLYQYQGWDVFQSYLSPRGLLYNWFNENPLKSFCDVKIDPFCDSPDTEVDIEQIVQLTQKALKESRSHCRD